MWKLIARDPELGDNELTAARSRRVTFRLEAPSEAHFTIDGRHEQAGVFRELISDLIIIRGKTALYGGVIGHTQDQLGPNRHTVTVDSLDYRARVERINIEDDLTFTAQDQSDIAWSIVTHLQGLTGGDLGITRGIGQVTGVIRDRTYSPGKKGGEAIQQLAEVLDGFDWDITPDRAFDLHYPQRGRATDVVLDYGGSVETLSRTVNTGDYANAIRMTGADGLDPAVREAPDLASRLEGRWADHHADSDLSLQATVNLRADWQIERSQIIQPAYTLELREGRWSPQHLWLGDTARVVIQSGRLNVDSVLRVYEIDVSIGDDGQEDVKVTVGAPAPDFRTQFFSAARRLDSLERR